MLVPFQRVNSSIFQKFRNIVARHPTGNSQNPLQVALLYKVNQDQLYAQVSHLNVIPFQSLPLTLFKPFSTSIPYSSCDNSGKDSSINEDLFKKMDMAAYRLLYIKLEEDEIMRLSALWMQAIEGPCKEPEPIDGHSSDDRIYWKHWKDLGNMEKEDAARKFLEIADRYV